MRFSCFATFGMLAFSSKPTHAEGFYKAMVASLGGQFATHEGSREDAKLYADAMAFARARYALEHAGLQIFPSLVQELLPTREQEYGVIPNPTDTLQDRHRALAAAYLLPLGASRTAVEMVLRATLGDDFVAYRPTPKGEALIFPAAPGDQPQNLQLASVPRKLIKLTESVTIGLGVPQHVRYERFASNEVFTPNNADFHALKIGDEVVIDPGNMDVAEVVEVQELSYEFDDFEAGPFYPTMKVTLNNAHAAGAPGTTAPWPFWRSSKRHNLVVLSSSAAADAESRRKADLVLGKVLRGVSTWDLAGESAPGSGKTGPFKVGVGQIGVTTIGTIDL